jgi:hypothetical protein
MHDRFSLGLLLQTQIRNLSAKDTSVNITRNVRTKTGRLAAGGLTNWKSATDSMKDVMRLCVFEPVREALEVALAVKKLDLKYFEEHASALLKNRCMAGADGIFMRDPNAGDAKFASFVEQMQLVAEHMVRDGQVTLHDVANFEWYLFFTSCLLGTAVLRPQSYRDNLINDVFMDSDDRINEFFRDPNSLKVQAGLSESGHMLVADAKSKEATLAWLMMVCIIRPMRSILDQDHEPSKLIWGMSGVNNKVVSDTTWANRIQEISKLHLGSPRTGMHALFVVYALVINALLYQHFSHYAFHMVNHYRALCVQIHEYHQENP